MGTATDSVPVNNNNTTQIPSHESHVSIISIIFFFVFIHQY